MFTQQVDSTYLIFDIFYTGVLDAFHLQKKKKNKNKSKILSAEGFINKNETHKKS